jgi:putative oxygen-independent coproporphyrinogen III oxidase
MASLYIHIPFCAHRCIYCDFYSTVGQKDKLKAYLHAVIKEFEKQKHLLTQPIKTIYIGGGTPSLLSEEELFYLFDSLLKNKTLFSNNMEVTLEANPEQLTKDYLHFLVTQTPINRLSIGVQSFNDKDLKLLNRRHSSLQAQEAILTSQEVGFRNISLDLIFALPSMSLDDWKQNLQKAIELNPQHISAYCLTLEQGTMLQTMVSKGLCTLATEEEQLTQFDYTMDFLQANGFAHYETSNYARKGFCSQHNSAYWAGVPYIGLGASAHSFNGTNRWWNFSDIDLYIKSIENNDCSFSKETLETKDHYNEYVLTHSRLAKGFSTKVVKEKYPTFFLDFTKNILSLSKQGLLDFDSANKTYTPTIKGWHLQDTIARELFV